MQGLSMPHMGSPDMGGQADHGLMPFASSQLDAPFAQLVPNGGGQLAQALPGSYQQAYITASGRPEYLADELLLAHGGDESQELAGVRQVCTFYLRTGTCAYGDRCKFQHPKDRPPPALNSRGYPIRNEVRHPVRVPSPAAGELLLRAPAAAPPRPRALPAGSAPAAAADPAPDRGGCCERSPPTPAPGPARPPRPGPPPAAPTPPAAARRWTAHTT
jgi:hypothetical protein